MSHNHVIKYFQIWIHKKNLNGNWREATYSLTCIPGRIAAQFNRHGNCATTTANTVALVKFQACVSKITVELTPFLPCILKQNITEGLTDVLRPVTAFAAALLQ